MSRLRRILHPTDFTRASGAAFRRAVTMAKADRAQLLLVHVLAPSVPMAGEGYISPKVYDDLETSARWYGQKCLAALHIEEGRPDRHRDHGRTGLAKFFLGSVASRVVAAAPCAVLTVRGR